jgi:hypothetical protein
MQDYEKNLQIAAQQANPFENEKLYQKHLPNGFYNKYKNDNIKLD